MSSNDARAMSGDGNKLAASVADWDPTPRPSLHYCSKSGDHSLFSLQRYPACQWVIWLLSVQSNHQVHASLSFHFLTLQYLYLLYYCKILPYSTEFIGTYSQGLTLSAACFACIGEILHLLFQLTIYWTAGAFSVCLLQIFRGVCAPSPLYPSRVVLWSGPEVFSKVFRVWASPPIASAGFRMVIKTEKSHCPVSLGNQRDTSGIMRPKEAPSLNHRGF